MNACGHSERRSRTDEQCGASDLVISLRLPEPLFCTLPRRHPMWIVNPATGYSYMHHDAQQDVWWNDGRPSTDRAASQTSTHVDDLPAERASEVSAQSAEVRDV